jgi:NitT/TauT family transport system substrate-binding protein
MRRPLAVRAAALMGAAGCASTSPVGGTAADGTNQVKVGVIPIVDVAPIYLGQQKGFFASRKIELSMESGQGGAAIVPGVVSGQFQFGFSNITSLLIAQTKNVPVKVVANGVASTGKAGADFAGVAVAKDSPIRSAADLAGRKIAVNTQFQRSFAIPEMWSGIILLGLLGVALSMLFRFAERHVLAWYHGLRGAQRSP